VILSAVRDGINARLATIPGLRTSDTIPDQVNPPLAVVGVPSGVFDEQFDGSLLLTFPIRLYVSLAGGASRSQDAIDAYLTGASEVRAAIYGDRTLGGAAKAVHVLGWDPYGIETNTAGVSYAVVDINTQVLG
jgi:hypothetical protein